MILFINVEISPLAYLSVIDRLQSQVSRHPPAKTLEDHHFPFLKGLQIGISSKKGIFEVKVSVTGTI